MTRIRRPSLYLLLLFLLVESAWSAWLVCDKANQQEDESSEQPQDEDAPSKHNKANCQLDLTVEEVAQAIHEDCQPSEFGVSCKLKVEDPEKLQKDGLSVPALLKQKVLTACDHDDEICIVHQMVSRLKFTSLETLEQAIQNAKKQATGESSSETLSSTQRRRDEEGTSYRSDSPKATFASEAYREAQEMAAEPSTTTSTAAATTTATAGADIHVETTTIPQEPLEFGIRVGNYIYQEPFDQYAPPLASTLYSRANLWRRSPTTFNDQFAFANGMLDIGIAHFTVVTEEDHFPGAYSNIEGVHLDSFDLGLAINAFQHGEAHYKRILDIYKDSNQESIVQSSLADLHLQWGEVLQSPHYYNHLGGSDNHHDNDPELEAAAEAERIQQHNQLALRHFELSEKHYRLSINMKEAAAAEANPDDANNQAKQEAEETIVVTKTHIQLAHVLMRIGRCMVYSVQGLVTDAEEVELETLLAMKEEPHQQQGAAETIMGTTLPQLDKLMKTIPKAEEKFEQAVHIYRQAIRVNYNDDLLSLQQYLASCLQDYSAATAYLSNIPKTIELQKESIELYWEITEQMHPQAPDRHVLIANLATALYTVSGYHMQLGQLDDTNECYAQSMELYEAYDFLEPGAVTAGYLSDEVLQEYEHQLTEYHDLVREINMPDGNYPDQQYMYQPNDAYEGDLHAALASAHLARDENLMAIDHYQQAIRLYEGETASGENHERRIADCKTSLAAAYYRNSQFRESAEAHEEAMEIYREVVGEGKNPMLAGLAEQFGVNIEDLGQATTGDLLGSQELQDLIANLDVDEAVKESLQSLTGTGTRAAAGNTHQGDNTQTITTTQTANTNTAQASNRDNTAHVGSEEDDESKGKQKVHQELIDLDKVRQSAMNASSIQEEL